MKAKLHDLRLTTLPPILRKFLQDAAHGSHPTWHELSQVFLENARLSKALHEAEAALRAEKRKRARINQKLLEVQTQFDVIRTEMDTSLRTLTEAFTQISMTGLPPVPAASPQAAPSAKISGMEGHVRSLEEKLAMARSERDSAQASLREAQRRLDEDASTIRDLKNALHEAHNRRPPSAPGPQFALVDMLEVLWPEVDWLLETKDNIAALPRISDFADTVRRIVAHDPQLDCSRLEGWCDGAYACRFNPGGNYSGDRQGRIYFVRKGKRVRLFMHVKTSESEQDRTVARLKKHT